MACLQKCQNNLSLDTLCLPLPDASHGIPHHSTRSDFRRSSIGIEEFLEVIGTQGSILGDDNTIKQSTAGKASTPITPLWETMLHV